MSSSHWTNEFENELIGMPLIQRKKLRIQQGEIYAKYIRSIHLNLNEEVLYDQLIPALEKMLNIESVSIQCNDCAPAEKVDAIFQVIVGLENVREIELDITWKDATKILMLTPLVRMTSILLRIHLIPQDHSIESIFKVIENYKDLNSLKVQFSEQATKKKGFFREVITVLNPKLLRVTSLSIEFNGHTEVQDQEMLDFGAKVGSILTVRDLSINFNSAKVKLKGFEEFLYQLARSKLRLKALSLGLYCCPQQNTIKIFGSLLKHQEKLESLEINDFQIKELMLKPFFNHQKILKNLKRLHYDMERNNIRNEGLSSLARFLAFSKIHLTTIKIMFDYSQFSGDSVLELGKSLASMTLLKDLRMEFTGKIKDASIVEFAENIASCNRLEYLYINFSGSGEKNIVEAESDYKDQSIFDNKKITFVENKRSYYDSYTTGQFHYLVVHSAIAKKMRGSGKNLTLLYPNLRLCPEDIDQAIRRNLEELVSRQSGLASLNYMDTFSAKRFSEEFVLKMITENASNLVSLEISTLIPQQVMDVLRVQAKGNLVRLQFLNQRKQYPREQIFKDFPNLIDLNLTKGYDSYVQANKFIFSAELIQTDLNSIADFHSQVNQNQTYYQNMNISHANLQVMRSNSEANKVKECLNLRKRTILSLIPFKRDIFGQLTFKPQFMFADLWIDI